MKFRFSFDFLGKTPVVVCIFLGILTLAWHLLWVNLGVDAHHDGFLLKPAIEVAHGQMLFRDAYTMYGALTTWTQAAFCKCFGESLFLFRTLTAFFYIGCTLLVYLLAREILRPAFQPIPVLLVFLFAPFYYASYLPWSSIFALFFSLLLCYVLVRNIHNPISPLKWFGIGILTVFPFWYRQPTGLVIPAVFYILFLYHWKFRETWKQTSFNAVVWLGGIICISGIICGYIWMNGAWDNFIAQSFGVATTFARERTGGLYGSSRIFYIISLILFKPEIPFYRFVGWAVIGSFVFSSYLIFLKKDTDSTPAKILAISAIAGVSLHQHFPIPCYNHAYWACLIGFLCYVWCIQALYDHCNSYDYRGLGIFFLIGMLFLPVYSFGDRQYPLQRIYWKFYSYPHIITEEGLLKNMRVTEDEYQRVWKPFFTALNELPPDVRNRPIVNCTQTPLFSCFFENKTSCYPNYYFCYKGVQEKNAMDILQKYHPMVLCRPDDFSFLKKAGYITFLPAGENSFYGEPEPKPCFIALPPR